MRLSIEPRLMERVVWEALRAAPAEEARFQQERVACYALSTDERERAFEALYAAWFDRLGYRAALDAMLASFPNLSMRVPRAVVSCAGRSTQGAELFGEGPRRVLTIRVHPSTLLARAEFHAWARHELMHVEDILDPAFGFDRDARPTGASLAAANLARERYAVLWAISIDARTSLRHELPVDCRDRRRRELARAWGLGASAPRVFERLWEEYRIRPPTHAGLLQAAERGASPIDAPVGADVDTSSARAACPVCGFSTFDWADIAADRRLAARVSRDVPTWTAGAGICRRCAEVYRSAPQAVVG